ncbi:ATP-binding protein [Marinomonas pollencensis]|uniref:AAA+ ATPase superfamily predicted ATPase n=1 Tax=Marinomonas pollencensis TaxID=491954 RepID=A0A3E0DR87_9GAMM|nr:ATP-binding protein [Marinomonas pollencensis]REG85610.1 AAA+ ATPase superfamily predicted ATPase [Marinomonas pollencensis]
MINRKFPITGNESKLIGRSNILNEIFTAITKPVPDHIQVVGPRYSGKTVVLEKLKEIVISEGGTEYSCVLLWDLGHSTPKNDSEFLSQFASNLSEAIKDKFPDYSEHLKSSKDTFQQDIAEVLEVLNDETKILVIFDGFDKALSSDKLTRNLWDQLRELAQNKSLTLITASRKSLRELIRNPDAQTSDFWNIFLSTPIRIDCFDENEIADILTNYCQVGFEKGALTELYNATNGTPVVLLEVLNYLLYGHDGNNITNALVQEAVSCSFESNQNFIDDLWHDCLPATQDTIRLLVEGSEIHGVSQTDKISIEEKGFARVSGNKLTKPSRLLQIFLGGLANEKGAIDRLFQNEDVFAQNFNNVISKRLAHIPNIDTDLMRYLQTNLEHLPNHPSICLEGMRGLINKCFDIIWNAEFGGKTVPDGHFDIWRYHRESERLQDFKTSFPQGGKRLFLLKVLTTPECSNPLAKVVSQSTYVAINALYPFGDFGQHQEGEKMNLHMVYSSMLLAIELVASLENDLAKSKDGV